MVQRSHVGPPLTISFLHLWFGVKPRPPGSYACVCCAYGWLIKGTNKNKIQINYKNKYLLKFYYLKPDKLICIFYIYSNIQNSNNHQKIKRSKINSSNTSNNFQRIKWYIYTQEGSFYWHNYVHYNNIIILTYVHYNNYYTDICTLYYYTDIRTLYYYTDICTLYYYTDIRTLYYYTDICTL